MLQMKNGQWGPWLLKFVGLCGEVPVQLVHHMGGCYDYHRKIVTKLVREGYLKERRMKGYHRHIVRSLSLTEKGLSQLQHLSPEMAMVMQEHALSPGDGQGDWKKTLRLHRNAACLLTALRLSAIWRPGAQKEAAADRQLVYYSTYETHRMFGSDSKGSRVSGVFFLGDAYFPVCYLGKQNLLWNRETEKAFLEQLEYSPLGRGKTYGGHILLGEEWSLAENLVAYGRNPRTRLIRIDGENRFFYTTLDRNGLKLLRLILDPAALSRFQKALYDSGICEPQPCPDYLFDLEEISDFYTTGKREQFPFKPMEGHFFDFQMEAMKRICNTGAALIPIPGSQLEDIPNDE